MVFSSACAYAAPLSLVMLVFAASPLACAPSGKSTEERLLDEMQKEINDVQSDSDKFGEHVENVNKGPEKVRTSRSTSAAMDSPAPPTPRGPSASIATPDLPLVRLEPDATGGTVGAAQTPDGTEGEETPIPTFTNANLGLALASHSASHVGAPDESAKHAYDAAQKLVGAKRYPEALDALSSFLARWPDHPNAGNALYSRGECYFAQGDFTHAAQELEGLLARFPTGSKTPDALLRLGQSEQHLDDASLARKHFDRLRRDFPQSDAAKRIPKNEPSAAP